MQLKTVEIDGKTYAEVLDGKPVYKYDDGKDLPFDAVNASSTIKRQNHEAMTHREAKEALERQVKAFDGIADPAAAIKALETVANLDAKKLIDAGEVERVRESLSQGFQTQIADKDKAIDALNGQLADVMIGGAFAGSAYVGEKLILPPDIARATFGRNFKVEEGAIVAYDNNGQKIYSRSDGGLAGVDEALEILVDQYPSKDKILKAEGGSGSGSQQSKGSASLPKGDFGGDRKDRTAAIASQFPDLPRA